MTDFKRFISPEEMVKVLKYLVVEPRLSNANKPFWSIPEDVTTNVRGYGATTHPHCSFLERRFKGELIVFGTDEITIWDEVK